MESFMLLKFNRCVDGLPERMRERENKVREIEIEKSERAR
jgi:hypothetical protein